MLVDLVCGPASPLPETYQRYRLVARLGSGGQADVYRAVRLCGGVTSAPITVKVFRLDPRRPLVDELRSWDKGDAALMDLNNRGVPGICRRADGFYGPPPHPSGVVANTNDAVPYQIYDYLHGVNLREYITARAGVGGIRLNATASLFGLAETLRALHLPAEPGACPVLHMDIKPSNIMVLTNGETRLIDFTGARYWRRAEITQIAYTPESGGPEALRGEVGPSYDVHGLGAVAFYMIAGSAPRGSNAPPLHRHPIFENRPALREHLLAALADDPRDRPSTVDLPQWVMQLAKIIRASQVPDLGVDWSDPRSPAAAEAARVVGRARPVLPGTETDAYVRIEALERELVALRARMAANPVDAHNIMLGALPTDPNPVGTVVPTMPTPMSVAPPTSAAPPTNGPVPYQGLAGAGRSGVAPVAGPGGAGGGRPGAAGPAGMVPGGQGGVAGGLAPTVPNEQAGAVGSAATVPAGHGGPHGAGQGGSKRGGSAGNGGSGGASAGNGGGGAAGSGGPNGSAPAASAMPATLAAPDPLALEPAGVQMRPGRAAVPPRGSRATEPAGYPSDLPPQPPQGARVRGEGLRRLKRGGGWTATGAVWAALCWIIWAAANRSKGLLVAPVVFVSALAVALFVFIVLRLVGRMVLENWMHRRRRGAIGAHLGTFAFLVAVGVTFLQDTSWISTAVHWLETR